MNSRFATPAAFRQALEAQVRKEATASGQPMQRVRQLVVFDRFLARVSERFGERVILKGGVALELRIAKARATRDIDLRAMGKPSEFLEQLQEAGRADAGDFLAFEVTADRKAPVLLAEGLQYGGRRFRAEGRLAGKVYGAPFGVDVAFAEPVAGVVDGLEGPALVREVGLEPARLRVYPIEAHIAEKLHALTLPRERPNSRVKDLPDVALLASVRAVDLSVLLAAVRATFEARATHDVPRELPELPAGWRATYERMVSEFGLPWESIEELTDAVLTFLAPVLEREGVGSWDPVAWRWR